MPIPENFKYDIRVRERMLRRGLLTEGELAKHIESLTDVAELLVEVELKQPALVKESERETRVLPRASSRPAAYVPPIRSLENELNDIDDDDDDDDDELDVKAKPKAEAAVAVATDKPVAEAVAATNEESSESEA